MGQGPKKRTGAWEVVAVGSVFVLIACLVVAAVGAAVITVTKVVGEVTAAPLPLRAKKTPAAFAGEYAFDDWDGFGPHTLWLGTGGAATLEPWPVKGPGRWWREAGHVVLVLPTRAVNEVCVYELTLDPDSPKLAVCEQRASGEHWFTVEAWKKVK